MAKDLRLKIDVTPEWWRTKAKTPELFAEWLVMAIRVVLGVWPQAQIHLSPLKLMASVSFVRDEWAANIFAQKSRVKQELNQIVAQVGKESDRSDSLPTMGVGWVALSELRPGAIFRTKTGVRAVKSQFKMRDGLCGCTLLENGDSGVFGLTAETHNTKLVQEIILPEEVRVD